MVIGGLLAGDRPETGLEKEGNKVAPKTRLGGIILEIYSFGDLTLISPLRDHNCLLICFLYDFTECFRKIMPCVLVIERASTKTVFPFCKSQVENVFGHIAPTEKLF